MDEEELDLERYERERDEAATLLPAWFTRRMMDDNWSFGLLLTTGQVLCISTINSITQAADKSLWLDVDMLDDVPLHNRQGILPIIAPTSRTRASVNAANIVVAFELADT